MKHGSIRELVTYFLRLGTTGFGGPVALVGLMERDLVTNRGWLTREEMREIIAVSQSLPRCLRRIQASHWICVSTYRKMPRSAASL